MEIVIFGLFLEVWYMVPKALFLFVPNIKYWEDFLGWYVSPQIDHFLEHVSQFWIFRKIVKIGDFLDHVSRFWIFLVSFGPPREDGHQDQLTVTNLKDSGHSLTQKP